MKIFMLGWEFPPFISGGLGTACHGLTKAMSDLGLHVTFVVPKPVESNMSTHVKMLSPLQCRPSKMSSVSGSRERQIEIEEEITNVSFRHIPSSLRAYTTPEYYEHKIEDILTLRSRQTVMEDGIDPAIEQWLHETDPVGQHTEEHYGDDMYSEIHRYAAYAVRLAMEEDFDLIHAHDWMTYPAGIAVASVTGKPLVIHVHSTEFDRSGEHVNQMIYDIERRGMHAAQKIIAVSHLTRNIIISRYGILGEKVEVVYNGVEQNGENRALAFNRVGIRSDEKIILFLGRITMQKGPEYFLMAARKVLEEDENVKFVMAGSGDMIRRTIELAATMGIGQKVAFTGFLRGADVDRVFEMAGFI